MFSVKQCLCFLCHFKENILFLLINCNNNALFSLNDFNKGILHECMYTHYFANAGQVTDTRR